MIQWYECAIYEGTNPPKMKKGEYCIIVDKTTALIGYAMEVLLCLNRIELYLQTDDGIKGPSTDTCSTTSLLYMK
jgi:hypothetical protein